MSDPIHICATGPRPDPASGAGAMPPQPAGKAGPAIRAGAPAGSGVLRRSCAAETGLDRKRLPVTHRRALAALCAAFASAGPAAAQMTFEQAVQANLALGMQLCLVKGVDGPAQAALFRQAGFTETIDAQSNGDTTHVFTAPANTARAILYYGNMPQECRVESDHMGVSQASWLTDTIVPQLRPGFRRMLQQGPFNPATGQPAVCVQYKDPTSEIGDIIGVLACDSGGGALCIENGTSQIYSSSGV